MQTLLEVNADDYLRFRNLVKKMDKRQQVCEDIRLVNRVVSRLRKRHLYQIVKYIVSKNRFQTTFVIVRVPYILARDHNK